MHFHKTYIHTCNECIHSCLNLVLSLANKYCYEEIRTKANYGFVYAHNFNDFEEKNIELTLKITPHGRKSISDIAGFSDEGIGVNNAI